MQFLNEKIIMSKISIILASKSARREKILKQIGLKFQIIPSEISEHMDKEISPKKLAKSLSYKKAEKIAKQHKNKIIIGADTVIYCNGKTLGKPKDNDENIRMLKSISGRTHSVFTGVTIIHKNKNIYKTFIQTTKVTVLKIPKYEIEYYIQNYPTLDKAGGYGIQGWFSVWIKRIDGCYFNVMGLPLSKFYQNYKTVINTLSNDNN